MRRTTILSGSIGLLIVISLVVLCTPGCDSSKEELQLTQKQNQQLTQRTAELEKHLKISQNTNQLYKQRLAELDTQLKQTENQLAQAIAQLQQAARPVSGPTTTAVTAAAGHTYEVVEGDSLWTIAEDKLGNGLRYKEILAINPNIKQQDSLLVGARLNLPSR